MSRSSEGGVVMASVAASTLLVKRLVYEWLFEGFVGGRFEERVR